MLGWDQPGGVYGSDWAYARTRQRGRLQLKTPPASEPVTLDQAKAHLRVDFTDDDALIGRQLSAARQFLEACYGKALITQTLVLYLDSFPIGLAPVASMWWPDSEGDNRIRIPITPVAAVNSVTYYAPDGTLTTMDPATYMLDNVSDQHEARLYPAFGKSWPSARMGPNQVAVEFQAGYGTGATSVPALTVAAFLLMLGDLYENRQQEVTGVTVNRLEQSMDRLMMPNRVHVFA
jgi:uncharacterized phiE125 gp8 family phage protein